MKTYIIMTSLLFVPFAIAADEVYIEFEEGPSPRVHAVKAEETKFDHFEVIGGADQASDFSVAFDSSVRLAGEEVALMEKANSIEDGIRTEVTTKRFIPLGHLPWTGKLSGKAVKVFKKISVKRSGKEAMLVGCWWFSDGEKMPAVVQPQFAADVYIEMLEFLPGGKLRIRRPDNRAEVSGTWEYIDEGQNEPGSVRLRYPNWGRDDVKNDYLVHIDKVTKKSLILIGLTDVPTTFVRRVNKTQPNKSE